MSTHTSVPIVFLGPSMPLVEAVGILDADFRPPCRRGDLESIAPGRVVALIDGVFHQSEAISPKEVLAAAMRHVVIVGGGSMGALRAAEVPAVTGLGHVYEMYKTGVIDSDDEVAVCFDPDRLSALTVPLVNVRYGVRRLVESGTISSSLAERLLAVAQSTHYTERTYQTLVRAVVENKEHAMDLVHLLSAIDVKKDDARVVLEYVAHVGNPEERLSAVVADEVGSAPVGEILSERPLGGSSPLIVWEGGDRMSFSELVTFMKVTGTFEQYAASVLLGLAFDHGSIEVLEQEQAQAAQTAASIYSTWGWRTNEEVRVTLRDFQADPMELSDYIAVGLARIRAVGEMVRSNDSRFIDALKCELLCDDIAMKREIVRCGSLSWLASRTSVDHLDVRPIDEQETVCRALGVASWEAAKTTLARWGVSDEAIAGHLEAVARARATVARHRAARIQVSATVESDAMFGLSSSPKAAGADRFCTSFDEAARNAESIRVAIGVTRVGMIDRLTEARGMFVSQVARPDGAWSSSYGSGKSFTKEGAIVGGIMEEAEKWAQERFVGAPLSATFEDLRQTGRAIDPRTLDLPYDTRYSDTSEIVWQSCRDLMTGREVMAPLALFATPATGGKNNIFYSPRGGRIVFSTNGLASGFTIAEAVLHAMCEYIERHATRIAEATISNPGVKKRGGWPRLIDPHSLSRSARDGLAVLQSTGCELAVWDVTGEIAVPTIVVRLLHQGRVSFGHAVHPRAAVAAEMALLEAFQNLAGNIAGGREDLTVMARSLGRHERSRPMRSASETFWSGRGSTPIPIAELGGFSTDDIYEEVRWVRLKLAQAAVEHILAVDLSRPEIAPAKVVRIAMPGLETTNPFYNGPRVRAVIAADLLEP